MSQSALIRQHLDDYFRFLAVCGDSYEAHAHSALLLGQLSALGVPDDLLRGFQETLPEFAGLVVETRQRQDRLEDELARLRSSSARKLGRVTRAMPDISSPDGDLQIWVDDAVSMLLPVGADEPPVGATVEYAIGMNGDAAYYGCHGFDHTGLVRAKLKSVEYGSDGRPVVEVMLRDVGDGADSALATCSEELLAIIDELAPGASVRVTEARPRVAYPGPAGEDQDCSIGRLVSPVTPLPESEDNFVYAPDIVTRIREVVQVLAKPAEAAQWGIEPIHSLALAGPTGVGKSAICRNLLGRLLAELGWQVFSANSDALTSFWYGESETLMRSALEAGGSDPTAIIIDEIDSVLPKRGAGQDSVGSDVASRVFSAFNEAYERARRRGAPPRLFVFTTNYWNRLDSAIRSRIDKVVDIPLPTPDVAVQIAAAYLGRVRTQGAPRDLAEFAIGTLNLPFVSVVFDSSDDERIYDANEVLSGRTLEQAVQSAAREAFFDGCRSVGALDLLRHLKAQLHGNLANLGRDDLAVALGVPSQDIHRVTSVRVDEEVVRGDRLTRRENRLRFRLAS